MVTQVRCLNETLGIELTASDIVDFHETELIRRFVVRNLRDRARQTRLFFHHDFRISESDVGDTASWDPSNRTLVHYKGYRYFLANVLIDGRAGIDAYRLRARAATRHGTWRDAEDGVLGMNPIAQGAVDSVGAAQFLVPAQGEKVVHYWLAASKSWSGTWDGVKELNDKIVARGPDALIHRTRAYWKLWLHNDLRDADDFAGLSPSRCDLYRRSLLVVRTHIDEGGGIIAANDSDITHFARDTYSYVWPRDGALVAHALDEAGFRDSALRFFGFCADVIRPEGYLLHKYNPDKSFASSWHPWVVITDGKVGAAQLPIQEDETALVLWSLWRHFARWGNVDAVKPLYGRLVRRAGDFLARYREPHTKLPAPSYDLWEERRGILTFTTSAVWGGLQAAGNFAEAFGEEEAAARYRKAAAEIREAMDHYLWRPELGRFARMINVRDDGTVDVDPVIDASLYGAFAFGAYAADDPKVVATMQKVEERLWCKTDVGGVARYEADYYHAVSDDKDKVPGNPWFICTMWLAQWRIAKAKTIAELAEALPYLEWTDAHKLPSGVLAEQVHPFTNAPLSVSPLTWSHATVVHVVRAYISKRNELERCPTCGGPKHPAKDHKTER